jgi:tight adherence protein C
MPITVILAAAAVAAALPLMWWSVASSRLGVKTIDRSVLAGGSNRPVDLRVAALQQSAQERAVKPLAGSLARFARRLTPIGWVESLERRITLAGRPAAWPVGRLLVAKIVLGVAAFGLGFLIFASNRTFLWLLTWGGMTALAYFAPDLLLYSRGQERQKAITKALPDTLDQMTISVEAGLGFESAMARTSKTGTGPLADELVRTLQEIQVGVPRTKAMRNLADRTESPDLRHFVLAIVQAENYGIPVADVLRTQAAEQRVKRRQRAEEHAMKIPVKIVFPLILCILPTLFIVILGPAAIQISRTLFGEGGAL